MEKLEKLVLMIFRTHAGEWLSPTKINAIVNAICAVDVPLAKIRRAVTKLTKQCKLVKSKTASAYMANN